jgi:hypothetical protein
MVRRLLLTTGVIGLLIATPTSIATAARRGQTGTSARAGITISPTSAAAGSSVQVSGSGCAGDAVLVTLQHTTSGATATSRQVPVQAGTFRGSVQIPAGTTSGRYTVHGFCLRQGQTIGSLLPAAIQVGASGTLSGSSNVPGLDELDNALNALDSQLGGATSSVPGNTVQTFTTSPGVTGLSPSTTSAFGSPTTSPYGAGNPNLPHTGPETTLTVVAIALLATGLACCRLFARRPHEAA